MIPRILFITSNRLGDAVLSFGVLQWLSENNPGALITVACGPIPSPLFADVPGVDRVIQLVKKSWHRHWWKLWQDVRDVRWEIVVDLRNSLVSRLVKAKKRLIFDGGAPNLHKVDALGQLIGMSPGPQPKLWFSAANQEFALKHLAIANGKPIIVVGPAANWQGKEWPMARFQALLARMIAADGPLSDAFVALSAAPDELQRAMKIWDVVPENRRIDLLNNITLNQVAACIAQSTIYVGNDSGLMHIAAAIGMPTVGVFGPSDDRVYGPRGPLATLVSAKRSAKSLLAGAKDGSLAINTLMDDIVVDDVYHAVCDVLGRSALCSSRAVSG